MNEKLEQERRELIESLMVAEELGWSLVVAELQERIDNIDNQPPREQ